jgi:hypothetical protein
LLLYGVEGPEAGEEDRAEGKLVLLSLMYDAEEFGFAFGPGRSVERLLP